ncbi:MAG: YraN family protein [Gammaproteobacteria bacterium]|nr:YraN family protein [Gammaproteobacteria bacterium]MDH5630385.1 YraN family protein [Gammaproteobacteria bacterium]
MENKRLFGNQLEVEVCKYLTKNNCQIIETNFQSKFGEIDIIAQDKDMLAFVEVRYRKLAYFGGAQASVDRKKQSRIIKTASYYLQQKKLTHNTACRFDVVALDGQANKLNFNWIKSAFIA